MKPLDVLRAGVDSFQAYVDNRGEVLDPVVGQPTQYGTPYHALSQAVLAVCDRGGDASERERRLELAARGIAAGLDHVLDTSKPANPSWVDRVTGAVGQLDHRDFFWPAILKAWRLLRQSGHPQADALGARIASASVPEVFSRRPPNNWASVWLSGEWLRVREGLSTTTRAQIDQWIAVFFERHILTSMGLYLEPGHSNAYDLFTRHHLLDLLAHGYDGAHRRALEELLRHGLRRSLGVQLSDGSLASAHRSTGQTWTLGAQTAYFRHAAAMLRDSEPALAAEATEAAKRALLGLARYQRHDGPFSPVENRLPASWRVGYEVYSADANYGNLALAFLAMAILEGLDDEPLREAERAPAVFIERDPTWRALAHHGRMSVQFNGQPAAAYDGYGITDLTFGPGRRLQWASSAHHLSQPGAFFNIGPASRSGPGRGALAVLAQQRPVLVEPIGQGEAPASLVMTGRVPGEAEVWRSEVTLSRDGARIVDATPGQTGHKTLLVPYLRDAGGGDRTALEVQSDGAGVVVRWTLGVERVRLRVAGRADPVLDLPYGYENRRGVCGLLRIDLTQPCDAIVQEWAIEA